MHSHHTARTAWVLALVAFGLWGCQSGPQTPAPTSDPKILSSMGQGGRGIPNGRSDSEAAYYRGWTMPASSDATFGLTPNNPIRTGPVRSRAHILFLNSLRGPNGEPVAYERRGSCCAFEDKNVEMGGGLLDVYVLKADGSTTETLLYVDMYRQPLRIEIPHGFSQRK